MQTMTSSRKPHSGPNYDTFGAVLDGRLCARCYSKPSLTRLNNISFTRPVTPSCRALHLAVARRSISQALQRRTEPMCAFQMLAFGLLEEPTWGLSVRCGWCRRTADDSMLIFWYLLLQIFARSTPNIFSDTRDWYLALVEWSCTCTLAPSQNH